MSIAENIQSVRNQVERLAGGRPVLLLAVTKSQPPGALREAWAAGQRAFGESYLQEALTKQEALRDLAAEWHFIGPVQSNKTRPIALHFQWVHSVDRLKIAERLSAARQEAALPPIDICLQVNLSGEGTKSGLAPEEVAAVAEAVAKLPGVRLRGLMTIPEPTDDEGLQHRRFASLRLLQETLNARGLHLDTLSMGMSQDIAAAVAEGSTILRIGTALFGSREKTS
jgi:pyridoxal phosphate enzyme (YggS family)